MEIKIRNVNPSIVKELDEKAKDIGVSRQEFLKDILENYTLLNDINDREREYKNHLDKATEIISIASEKLEENTKVLNMLMEDEY